LYLKIKEALLGRQSNIKLEKENDSNLALSRYEASQRIKPIIKSVLFFSKYMVPKSS